MEIYRMAEHNELGEKGEDEACIYMQKSGYTILARNWRKGKLEIDLIARMDNTIVFIEVKSRKTDFFGKPESFVDQKKQLMMAEAAEYYLDDLSESDLEIRYDIIALIIEQGSTTLMHFEDAFFPDNLGLNPLYD